MPSKTSDMQENRWSGFGEVRRLMVASNHCGTVGLTVDAAGHEPSGREPVSTS